MRDLETSVIRDAASCSCSSLRISDESVYIIIIFNMEQRMFPQSRKQIFKEKSSNNFKQLQAQLATKNFCLWHCFYSKFTGSRSLNGKLFPSLACGKVFDVILHNLVLSNSQINPKKKAAEHSNAESWKEMSRLFVVINYAVRRRLEVNFGRGLQQMNVSMDFPPHETFELETTFGA